MAAQADNDSNDDLERIKKNISTSYLYFKENVKRYHEFRKFVFDTSINSNQLALLNQQSRPVIEFNILEAYISRLLGEFSKHEPSIEVTPSEGVPVSKELIELVEGYIRHVVYEANKNSMSYEVYKDLLSGGFSVIKVWTEYASPMSMKQVIKTARVFDPTLTGFDPMARYSHKGDGQYSFELYPMTEDDFKRRYPKASESTMSYTISLEEFSWSFKDDRNEKTIMVADYYEKKSKRIKIVELADGTVMPIKRYDEFIKIWKQQQFIEQFPIIVGKPRWTEIETICCYHITENEILDYKETDYSYLPHIFVDGNSIILREQANSNTYQMTRPYIYHAKGIQNLKNFSGQCLANYLENMVQHKFIVKKEALPQEEDFIQALTDMQKASTVVVNAYSENNPDKPIPEPIREIVNVPAPPEVTATFQFSDPTTQTILGSYASNLGKNDNDLSGKAVIESASVGNSAAMPFVTGYLQAWTQLGNIIVDLMPKYIKGKRELPVIAVNGDKGYKKVNVENAPKLDYQQNAIHVNIEAGVNFQIQKNQALQQMSVLMGVSQEFNAFMNSPRGLPILVKNLTVYGSDELQEAVPEYIKEKAQQQQQAQQMQQQAMQNDPRMLKAQVDMQKAQIEAQKMQLKATQEQFDNKIAIARVAIEKELADAKILEAESKVSQAQVASAVRLEESQTSLEIHSLEAATKLAEIKSRDKQQSHDHMMDHHDNARQHIKLAHDLTQQSTINSP
jgi:hypothetical protein